VRHGLVAVAEDYPYCSAGWFKAHAELAFREKVNAVRYDQVNVVDDFEVEYMR
jgi:putative transposase